MRNLLFAAAVAIGACLSADTVPQKPKQNNIMNSSFELGDHGFACVKYLRIEANPELKFEGPVLDGSARVFGKKSLRIPNRFAEEIDLCTYEAVNLEPDTSYTVSVWMKSGMNKCPVTIAALACVREFQWSMPSKYFEVNNAWARYSFSFKTPAARDACSYRIRIMACREPNVGGGDLWLDGLQVNAGGLSDFAAAAEVEAALVPSQKLYVLEGGTTLDVPIKVALLNNTAQAANPEITLSVLDEHFGTVVFTRKWSVPLAPNEVKDVELKVPLGRFGAFCAKASIAGVGSATVIPGYFAVVGKYDSGKPIDLDKTFCVSFNEASCFDNPPSFFFLKKPGFRALGGDAEEFYRMLAFAGCRFLRDWGGRPVFAWRYLEPEKGKWDFRRSDMALGLAEKHGMRIMPVPGGSDAMCTDTPGGWSEGGPNGSWPAWAAAKGDKDNVSKNALLYPPLEAWADYNRNMAMRYKGRITHYEIMNEPNLFFGSPGKYVEYLKAASLAIKGVDPKAKIVGFCSTGDMKGNVKAFFEDCFKLGGLKYADIASFHPYGSRQLGSQYPADKEVGEIKELLEAYGGKDCPRWNTELYYLGKGGQHSPDNYNPVYAAQRFLTDLGEGVRQSNSVMSMCLFKYQTDELGQPSTDARQVKWQPSSMLVGYNALARFFEGAQPADKFRWLNEAICYVYKRDGQYSAACWNYGALKDLKLKLAMNARDVELYDLFGNRLNFDGTPFALGAAPCFLIWKGDGQAGFIDALKTAALEIDRPVSVTDVKVVPRDGGKSFVATLKNSSDKPCAVELAVHGEGFSVKDSIKAELEGLSRQSVAVVPDTMSFLPKEVTAVVDAKGKKVEFPGMRIQTVRFYDVAKEQDGGKKDELTHRTSGTGAMEAVFNAWHDERDLHVFVNVKDGAPSGAPGKRSEWEQDCVELFFDAAPLRPGAPEPGSYHDHVGRMFVMPYAPAGKNISFMPRQLSGFTVDKVKVEPAVFPGGYTIKLSIPLESLNLKPPYAGKFIGFDMAVDDADGGKVRHFQRFWSSPTGTAHKNRNEFGYLVLK